MDFELLLAKAGLEQSYGKESKAIAFAGMELASDSLHLTHVMRDGPAWKAGIVANDELVAINDLKVDAKDFAERIKDFKPGDTIKVTLFSNQRLKQVVLTLAEKQSGKLQLKAIERPSKEQKAFFKAWLGIDWPFDEQGKLN